MNNKDTIKYGPEFLNRITESEITEQEGVKHDAQKLRFDLIPPEALEQLAAVYTYGCHYGERNWEKGIKWGRIFAAIMRHLWAFWRGQQFDKESGLSHLSHASWGCFTLLTYQRTHPKLDDRSKL